MSNYKTRIYRIHSFHIVSYFGRILKIAGQRNLDVIINVEVNLSCESKCNSCLFAHQQTGEEIQAGH